MRWWRRLRRAMRAADQRAYERAARDYQEAVRAYRRAPGVPGVGGSDHGKP